MDASYSSSGAVGSASRLTVIDPDTDSRWDALVERHPQGVVYHHSAWGRVLRTSFGYTPFYVGIEGAGGELRGGIPFLVGRSWLTGTRVVSLPLSAYCPPLVGQEDMPAILDFVRARYPRASYIEIKQIEDPRSVLPGPPFVGSSDYVAHTISLTCPVDQLFKSFHLSSIRQKIKKAAREHLTFRMAEEDDAVAALHVLELQVRRRHGLPPHPHDFFANMRGILLPLKMFCLPVVECEGRTVAAGAILKFKDTWHLEYGVTDERYMSRGADQVLIWESIKLAMAAGARQFDLGRSALSHQSLIDFKGRWNAKPHLLQYFRYPAGGRREGGDGIVSGLMKELNRRLPVALLELEGRVVYRHAG